MSGAARQRGRGRAGGQESVSSPSRRGDRLAPPPVGGHDGPASRGSASGPGSHGRGPSSAASVSSGQGSPNPGQGSAAPQPSQAGSRHSTQSGGQGPTSGPAQPTPAIQGDPARDHPARYTDALRNIDLPPSFYNIDQLVSQKPDIQSAYSLLSLPLST